MNTYHNHTRPDSTISWFPSKVDWWMLPALAIGPAVGAGIMVMGLWQGDLVDAGVGLGICLMVAALYLGLIFPMSYGIGDQELIVRSGVVRHRIALRQITGVTPTRNPLSSPALSLDRLEIRWGKGLFQRVLISPRDATTFQDLLAQRIERLSAGSSSD